MKLILATAAVVATAGLLGASPAAAQGTLDQSFTSTSDTGVAFYQAIQLAQTFTAGRTGILPEVDLSLELEVGGNPPPLTVEIETVDANHQPSGTVLASATIPASAVVPGVFRWTPAVFSAPAFVVAGTQYAIVLSNPDNTTPEGGKIFVAQYGANTYSGGYALDSMDSGATWSDFQKGFALSFKTYVESEPTSIDRCKDGGWRQFGFKNVGKCVAFVIQTKICNALERHGIHLRICPPTPPRPN
jgi:hypothetical protein